MYLYQYFYTIRPLKRGYLGSSKHGLVVISAVLKYINIANLMSCYNRGDIYHHPRIVDYWENVGEHANFCIQCS